jgi:hypothetical protein
MRVAGPQTSLNSFLLRRRWYYYQRPHLKMSGTACPGGAGGSILRPKASSAVAKFLPKVAQISPRQCYAPKPLKFYNHKSKASRLSKMDDSLIVETLSVISAPSVVPRCVRSVSSPRSIIVAHTFALVPAS